MAFGSNLHLLECDFYVVYRTDFADEIQSVELIIYQIDPICATLRTGLQILAITMDKCLEEVSKPRMAMGKRLNRKFDSAGNTVAKLVLD